MQNLQLFPTNVYKDYINENMRLDLLSLCNKYTAETTTNLLHIENFPSTLANQELQNNVNNEIVVKMVFNFLFEKVKEISYANGVTLTQEDIRPYGFFSSMNKGAYLRQHSHKDCKFSGIIYLEVGDDVPGLLFHDPRPLAKFTNSQEHQSLYQVKAENNLLLIWDNWLDHEVLPKSNAQPRKSFTFNL